MRLSPQRGSEQHLQYRYYRSPSGGSWGRSSQLLEMDTSSPQQNLLLQSRSPSDTSAARDRSSHLEFQRGFWDGESSPIPLASPETRCTLRPLRLRGGVFGSLGLSRPS